MSADGNLDLEALIKALEAMLSCLRAVERDEILNVQRTRKLIALIRHILVKLGAKPPDGSAGSDSKRRERVPISDNCSLSLPKTLASLLKGLASSPNKWWTVEELNVQIGFDAKGRKPASVPQLIYRLKSELARQGVDRSMVETGRAAGGKGYRWRGKTSNKG